MQTSSAFSPDGRRLTFVAHDGGRQEVSSGFVRSMHPRREPLTGTEDASVPILVAGQSLSSDSSRMGSSRGSRLRAGRRSRFADAPIARGGTWNRDERDHLCPRPPRVRYSGYPLRAARPAPSRKLDECAGGTSHRWPYFLPDGQHFLYLSRGITVSGSETAAVYVTSLGSNESKLLLRVSSNVAYAQGYLLFLREGTLMAQAFDTKRLEMAGDAFPIAEGFNPYQPWPEESLPSQRMVSWFISRAL